MGHRVGLLEALLWVYMQLTFPGSAVDRNSHPALLPRMRLFVSPGGPEGPKPTSYLDFATPRTLPFPPQKQVVRGEGQRFEIKLCSECYSTLAGPPYSSVDIKRPTRFARLAAIKVQMRVEQEVID